MQINQDNYEQFFLDHAEGNLSPEMERELADFLEANPDLKPVLADFDPSPLQTAEIRNEILKARLKKHLHPTDHIREDNADEWMIREIEGLLNESEKKELKEFLTLNPAYVYDQRLFRLTKLEPDFSIIFPLKNRLKKKAAILPVSRIAWSIPAAAAIILLFIGIRFFRQPAPTDNLQVVQTEVQPVAEIPEPVPEDIETEPQVGLESRGTPAPVLRHGAFRLTPSAAKAIVSTNPIVRQEINLVAYNISPIITAEKKEKPLIAKVFGNMIAKARDGINVRTNPDKVSNPDFSFWSIAKAGIDGYNSISDRDLELYVRKDADGKIKSYALVDQDRLIWSKDLNKD